MPRDTRQYLFDIVETADRISSFVHGMDYDAFIRDEKTQFAVLHGLLVIGEATGKLPSSIKGKDNAVDWRSISAMRNIIVHEYFGVDHEIIWQAATVKLPGLREVCSRLLSTLT